MFILKSKARSSDRAFLCLPGTRNTEANFVSIQAMKLLCATLAWAGVIGIGSAAAALPALAQSASFTVSQNGKSVGTASYTFTATPAGYGSESLVRISMQGLDYALSKTEQL